MPALVSDARLMEAFASAHEQRSRGYQDLVSNSNVFFHTLKERGGWKTFSGPDIRETLLYAESGSYIRYSGFDFLNPAPTELFNDAVFEPKMAAVSITMSGEKMLKNSGPNQIFDLFEAHLEAAEQEMVDRFTEDLHSAGTETNQIGGLQLMVPTTPSLGTYGGIARSNAIWQTTTYDANSITVAGMAITSVTSATIRPLYNHAVINRSRNKKGPNLILAAQQHFQAYSAATDVIQRINDENALGKLGFSALKYFGAGKSIDIVLEGGDGSAMPDNVSYFLDMSAIKFRYHPDRNFSKIGGKQQPLNQDAVVQHVGFMGELTMNNPRHCVKLYDSAP